MEEKFQDTSFTMRQKIAKLEGELKKSEANAAQLPSKPATRDKDAIRKEIEGLVFEYFSEAAPKFVPGQTKIPLQVPTYGSEEVSEAIESLLSTWVTMGKKVRLFEETFASYIGAKHASMVNSGSSANLLALSILTNPALRNRILHGEEIITPAVTWATTVFPIANVNAVPVLADVDLDTFTIDTQAIEDAITEKTRAIMPVHLLGNPCDIKRIMEIAEDHSLFVIEDACEAHGATVDGRKVGSFGDLSAFSFFLSHHISTIEGGMVLTNNEEYSEMAKALRVFGWPRDLKNREEIARMHPDIDQRFLFINSGFNLRPTEIQGAFGIHQMKKLERFIEIRRDNAKFWNRRLSEFSDYIMLASEKPGTRHVWFGYPITVKPSAPFKKEEMVKFLEQCKIETRPIMAGNMEEQPAMKYISHRVCGDLKNSKLIMRNSFFFGNHQGIGDDERNYIADKISEFITKRARA
jgi:CDP-6-deoxy-D-xylo-4-hexulose-3-dehydrase